MPKKQNDPILKQQIKTLFPTEIKKSFIPLKDLTSIPLIFDVLGRKEYHHVFFASIHV